LLHEKNIHAEFNIVLLGVDVFETPENLFSRNF